MSSCSRAVHRHQLPSITFHRHAVHHRQVAIAPSLSVNHHCDRSPLPSRYRCPSPYIAIKMPSRHPSPSTSRRAVHCRCAIHCRRAAPSSRSRPSLSIRLLLSSCRRSVHRYTSLLSRRCAIHRSRTAPSITVKLPLRRPYPSITIAITVHHHRASAVPHRTSSSKSRHAINRRQRAVVPSIAVVPRRPSPSRSRPLLSIRLLLSSRRRSVH